ncbi:hypothetical protein C2845_PM07G20540 [Panicum miliaceum]|uniref:Uncharacterized protein n=1 Tax=Panicum miliaceum TaxID=4540 RepID=A0A3L6SQ09_PANMI|nr:hypothetical protein C2845_PM07G20540 [Panicum miliaceum]
MDHGRPESDSQTVSSGVDTERSPEHNPSLPAMASLRGNFTNEICKRHACIQHPRRCGFALAKDWTEGATTAHACSGPGWGADHVHGTIHHAMSLLVRDEATAAAAASAGASRIGRTSRSINTSISLSRIIRNHNSMISRYRGWGRTTGLNFGKFPFFHCQCSTLQQGLDDIHLLWLSLHFTEISLDQIHVCPHGSCFFFMREEQELEKVNDTYDKLLSEVPKNKQITPSILSEHPRSTVPGPLIKLAVDFDPRVWRPTVALSSLMADDDFDGLPMYVEEEEVEAEKQKRRQQSRQPPPPPPPRVTPEELARTEFNEAMARKLFEYDPKLGGSYYTRVWFLDFTKVDIDEESIALN